ncbi:MAG: type II secretion system F family protein [Syntrophomonadaceae bacterium]|jgi:tight adherence protein C|nr:type II secretion system F family protein [Bacillota bacterium]
MEFVMILLVVGFVSFMFMGITYIIKHDKLVIINRLEQAVASEDTSHLPPLFDKPLHVRVAGIFSPLLNRIATRLVSANKRDIYETRLAEAGHPWGMNADSFILGKYILVAVLLGIGILGRNVTFLAVLLILSLLAPDMFLKSNEKKRKEQMLKSMPDILDLINVSVEAGLGFDAALQKVVDKTEGPLTQEFAHTLNEINIGKPRREALRDMADRIKVDDISTFLGSVIQADQLGVSITNVMRIQSQQVRENRRMRAEEAAQKAPIKILIPLVLFIFPTILVVLLGPAIISLMDNL